MKIPSNQEITVTYIVDGQERFVETRNFDHSIYTIYEINNENNYIKLKQGKDLLKVREVLKGRCLFA